MASLIGTIFRVIWHALCGAQQSETTPSQQQQQQHYQLQQHKPEHVSHGPHVPQQQQQQQPHRKPFQPYDINRPRPTDSPHYTSLRARAVEEGDRMARCFDESQEAYRRGDGALAKKLSDEGKQHQADMNRLNREASRWVFNENNRDRQPGEIDLHGLFVKEAVDFTEEVIKDARGRGDKEIRVIVGKGLHSQNNIAKVKPAIEKLIHENNLVAVLDPDNSGVLVVHLDGRGAQGRERRVGADEITRGLEDKDRECVIM